ncbi:MAG: carbohydrate ABC transporter permease, partial [Armatimonadetes bacterium]|nr:carbohydrate ABC transporter permease [Anaerolineae bacterium]
MAAVQNTQSSEVQSLPRRASAFLTRLQGGSRFNALDTATYAYLILGTLVMFVPVLWLVMSSFKSQAELYRFPPTFLPYRSETISLPGYDAPLPLYEMTLADGTVKQMAQVAKLNAIIRLIDPANPEAEPITAQLRDVTPLEYPYFALDNYTGAIRSFPFTTYLGNSILVTTLATIITLLINSMAAFGLSKYKFAGRDLIFYIILGTLMVPVSVILVPA